MKRNILFILLFITLTLPLSAKSNEMSTNSILGLGFTGLPDDFLYPSYLADPLAVKSQLTYRKYSIDEVHPQSDGTEGHLDATIGKRLNFLRFSPEGKPNLGLEFEIGMAITTFMHSHGTDLLDFDGIYYMGIAIKPNEWSSYRIHRHHICSHQGDQLDEGDENDAQYVDFDYNISTNASNYVRDDYMLSAIIEPLFFLNKFSPLIAKSLRVYGDYTFHIPGESFLGRRSNSPTVQTFDWYQYGAELEVPIENKKYGSLFVAGQVSKWQESAYAQYYDGQSLLNNFRFTRTKYLGLTFTIDD